MRYKTILALLATISVMAIATPSSAPFAGSGIYCSSASSASCHIMTATSATTTVEQSISSAQEVTMTTERGVGEDIDYIPSKRLILNVLGQAVPSVDPLAFNPYGTYNVLTTKRLAGEGLRELVKNPNGSLSLTTVETPLSDYVKKDTVVLVQPAALTSSLIVDASSGLNGQNAGDVVVVADSINTLTVKSNGYDGKNGESPLRGAAKKAVDSSYSDFATVISQGISESYKSKRQSNGALGLDMNQADLDDYQASGLSCRSDETAVVGTNPSNSYALNQAGSSGLSVPEGIDIVTLGREEAKRTLCRRPASMSAVQSCAADREFAWQIACTINQEQRSIATFKRAPVKWQRLLCAGSTTSQIRRKIVRQANVTVSIPGGKSYTGLISRTISFDDSAQVYIPNAKSEFFTGSTEKWIDNCSNGTGTTEAACTNGGGKWSANGSLAWYNPFWLQDIAAGQGTIETAANVLVNNGATDSSYPSADTVNPLHNKGVALSFVPRPGSESVPTLLFPQIQTPENFDNTYNTNKPYRVSRSCANLVDLGTYNSSYGIAGAFSDSHPVRSKTAALGAPGAGASDLPGGPAIGTGQAWANNPKRYPTVESLLAFDSRDIGFSAADLAQAAGIGSIPASTGVIEVTNCTSFEVMDGVVTGDASRGAWALISGAPDQADVPTTPSSIPQCSELKPQAIGSETFVQYEDDQSCYVNDPTSPPDWLKAKLQADVPSLGNTTITSTDMPIDYLSSKSYVGSDVFANSGFPAGAVPTASEVNQEFIWPTDMTTLQIAAVAPVDRDGFCVEPEAGLMDVATGLPSRLILSAKETRHKLTRSRLVQKYDIPATSSSGVAIPTGALKKICAAGIRLDTFLSLVSRPTCRQGTSTKQKLAWWSDLASANTWHTWTQKNTAQGVLSTQFVGDKYSLKSETTDTRYDELPPTVITAATNEVDPSVYLPASESSTGKEFPEAYGFKAADQSRIFPGWARESSLINSATVLTADSFNPYAGLDTNSRKAQWCNAQAYEFKGGKFLKSFGAKGLMRDPAKHVYGFDVLKGGVLQKYVAVEVTGTNEQYGFYMTADAFPSNLSAKFQSTAQALSTSGSLEGLFKKKTYPNIGGRFMEQCASGEAYNQFTGFCHAVDNDTNLTGSWRSAYRTVERYDENNERKSWAVKWDVSDAFLSAIKVYNSPFSSAVSAPIGGMVVNNLNPAHLARVGLFRPVKDMSNDDSGLDLSVVTNRPETLSKAARGPFFAEPMSATAGGICQRSMRMIAVPVPSTNDTVGGVQSSVVIDPASEYLPSGAMFMAIDFECAGSDYTEGSSLTLRGAIIAREGTTVSNLNISPGAGFTSIARSSGNALSMTFASSNGGQVVQISNIKESMVSGMSATTGFETLSPSTIKIKQRDRSAEWLSSGRYSGGRGWQQSIKTSPTTPVTDGAITALSCSPDNLRDGGWPSVAPTNPPITNAASVGNNLLGVDCSTSPATCALTEEELSLFSKVVPDSLTPITTRPGVEQYTPWSFELPASALRTGTSSSAAFNQWTARTPDGAGAPTPSCDIFNSSSSSDGYIPRTSLDVVPAALQTFNTETATIDITKPGSSDVFMSVSSDQDLRKSNACLEWDQITGTSCLEFAPSIDRADLAPYVFGGQWNQISVATSPRRVSQDCGRFVRDSQNNAILTEKCSPDLRPLNLSTAACDPTKPTSALCLPCLSGDGQCAPWMLPKGAPKTSFCKPGVGGCDLETSTTMEQVERSVAMPGQPGQNGTDGGAVTVFCGNCGSITVENRGGLGGTGSNTVSSSVSPTLTCVSWNHNPIAPKFFSRQLWSRPFDGAGNGQNGVRGLEGGEKKIYSDMTPEALFMISQPEFWKN